MALVGRSVPGGEVPNREGRAIENRRAVNEVGDVCHGVILAEDGFVAENAGVVNLPSYPSRSRMALTRLSAVDSAQSGGVEPGLLAGRAVVGPMGWQMDFRRMARAVSGAPPTEPSPRRAGEGGAASTPCSMAQTWSGDGRGPGLIEHQGRDLPPCRLKVRSRTPPRQRRPAGRVRYAQVLFNQKLAKAQPGERSRGWASTLRSGAASPEVVVLTEAKAGAWAVRLFAEARKKNFTPFSLVKATPPEPVQVAKAISPEIA